MGTKTERIILLISTAIAVAFMTGLAVLSSGVEGGMDSYQHYLIAKYSWQYPRLILDYWGKPVYNLLASPFTQLGMAGSIGLNILCWVGSAWLAYFSAKRMGIDRFAFVAFFLTLLSPIFLDNTISSLTEPLTAFLVMLSMYFLVSERIALGALVTGFLPHARSEGFIVLFAVFCFMLLTQRKWHHYLYLGIGSLLFNTIGWWVTGQPFWIFTENPYINFELSGNNICGSGGLFHYVHAAPYTFGKPAAIAMFLGGLVYAYRTLRNWRNIDFKLGLILLTFSLYFASHAAIWYLGKMGSCGFVRVMVVIAPLGAMLAAYFAEHAGEFLHQKFGKIASKLFNVTVILTLVHAVWIPYRFYGYKYPFELTQEQQQYVKLYEEWYQYQAFDNRTKLYLYPLFSILADIDPYDQKQHLELWRSSLQWSKKGDILIWDGHFGPNEGQLPLDTLKARPEWEHIYSVIPEQPMKTLNDYDFEIHVFEKIK